jgi:predicted esterase
MTIHEDQPVLTAGGALSDARIAVILLHGRGGTAQDILGLAGQLPQAGIAYLAPQAAGQTWYPYSGFGPLETNEPYISSALHTVAGLLAEAGLAPERVLMGGFSQGACVIAEFAARNPRRYGGLFVLSGALLGPVDLPRDYSGSLDGTPVFVGGCNHDNWVTEQQLRLTAQTLQDLGGVVQIEIQPGSTHTIRASEVVQVARLIAEAAARG